jgi:hypothetical protein
MKSSVLLDPVLADIRMADGSTLEDIEWPSAGVQVLKTAAPWRSFRWRDGQKHYSGCYWSATMRDHVGYESRMELGRLLLADFDPDVRHIVSQPFLLKTEIDGKTYRHVPDFLLLTDAGPVVVDVKPRHRLEQPKVAFCFAWTRRAVEARGWRYEVYSDPPEVLLENVRFLTGYRRDWLFDVDLLEHLRKRPLDGLTLGEAVRCLPEEPEPVVKAALLHLLWSGWLATDLDRPLSPSHVLRRSA